MGDLDELFDEIGLEFGQGGKKEEKPKQEEKAPSESQKVEVEQVEKEETSTAQPTFDIASKPEDSSVEVNKVEIPQESTQPATMQINVKKEEAVEKPKDSLSVIISPEDEEEEEFSIEPESPEPKEVWLIAGEKGEGKTAAAFSFVDRPNVNQVVCIAFDNKSSRIWWSMYNGDPKIVVFSGIKEFKYKSKDEITSAAARTYKYLMSLLDALEKGITVRVGDKELSIKKPDWIIIDNTEVFMRIAEFTARYYWKIPPFAGAEWKLWDERNYYIRELFLRCFDVASKGVIYTTYLKESDVLVEGGQTVRRKEVPKWVDAIKYETDFVVKIYRDTGGRKFFAEIISSKDDNVVPTGAIYDITDIGFWKSVLQNRLKGSPGYRRVKLEQ